MTRQTGNKAAETARKAQEAYAELKYGSTERMRLARHITDHLAELPDEDLDMLNDVVVAMLCCEETHSHVRSQLGYLKATIARHTR